MDKPWLGQAGKNDGSVKGKRYFESKPELLSETGFQVNQLSSLYPLVNKHSYGKWSFIVNCPIKHCDFP